MKKSAPLIKIVAILVMNAFTFHLAAQKTNSPKNFPGLLAAVEWNTISGTWGLEYERLFHTKGQLTIGAKATYIAEYNYGNLEILSGTNCCESATHGLLMGTGSYFTGAKKNFSGFFVHTALGAGFTMLKYHSQAINSDRTIFRPTFEIGPGVQIRVGETVVLRWKGTVSFGPYEGSLTSTTLSLGF